MGLTLLRLTRSLLPALLAVGLGAFGVGCSVESDAGDDDRPQAGSGVAGSAGEPSSPSEDSSDELTIQGEPIVRLGFGESVELTVLLTDDGRPSRRETISFDLVGRPEDSSLTPLIVRTNSAGLARATLRAASRPAMFEARASNGGTTPVSYSVSVSGSGFGTLIVTAPYSGVRAVEERFVIALPGLSCDDAAYVSTDPRTVFAPGEDSASLIALPAGISYAVQVFAKSASGAVVARGCDEVTITAQADDQLAVTFIDAPLVLDHRSSLEVTLEAGSAAAALGSSIRSAVSALVRLTSSGQNSAINAEGRFWLDSLDTVLREDEDDDALIDLADMLMAARLDPMMGATPESSLAGLLEVNAEGAGVAGSAMASHVRDSLDSIVLYADIGFETSKGSATISLQPLRMEALPVMEGAEPPGVDLSDTDAAAVDAELLAAMDTLVLHEVELSPRLGALASAALDLTVVRNDSGFGKELRALAGCTTIEEWLHEQTFVVATACNDDCVARVCANAMNRVLEVSRAALAAQDEQRPRATLAGELALTDDDGDLLAEQMQAERIDGQWAPAPDASLGDTLRGTAIAHAASSN